MLGENHFLSWVVALQGVEALAMPVAFLRLVVCRSRARIGQLPESNHRVGFKMYDYSPMARRRFRAISLSTSLSR